MAFELFALIAIAALVWAWHSRAAVQDNENLCAHCGYDLRASTGRCPECGMPFIRGGEHVPLRDDWPADAISPRTPRADEFPVVIHTTEREWEARTLREQLQMRGVTAQVQEPAAQRLAPDLGLPVRPRGSWHVAVWSGDAELATAIRDKLIPFQPPPDQPE